MRRKSTSSVMNLDSLLDTVTNVVGFLIIVLAVVQMNAVNASKRMLPKPTGPTSGTGGSPERAKALTEEIAELYVRLASLLKQIEQERATLAPLPGLRASRSEKASLDMRIRQLLAQIEEIKKKITDARRKLADLTAAVKAAESKPSPPAVRISNIRIVDVYDKNKSGTPPDWVGKKGLMFICRRGRVFRYDDELPGRAIRKCLGIPAGGKILISGQADLQKLKNYFRTRDVGDRYIHVTDIRFVASGARVAMAPVIEFREGSPGETAANLASGGSQFENYLSKSCTPENVWVRFLVWSDSFRTYRAARAAATKHKYQVGWLPFDKDDDFPAGGAGSGTQIGPGQ